MVADFHKALFVLQSAGVEFIVIGGVAGALHGAEHVTFDLDVVYNRSRENIRRLAGALHGHNPYFRGVDRGLPFSWDEQTIRNGLNFTLETSFGDLDLLGEVAGGGTYLNLLPDSQEVSGFGLKFRIVTLPRLIALKRAAGRPKDLPMIVELQELAEKLNRKNQSKD